jgi:hypothetical protein
VLAGEIPAEPVPLGVHSSLVSLVDESEAGLSLLIQRRARAYLLDVVYSV